MIVNSRLRVVVDNTQVPPAMLPPAGPSFDYQFLFARIRRFVAMLTVMFSLPFRFVAGVIRLCYRFAVGLHWFVYRAQYAVFGMAILGGLLYCFWQLFLMFRRHI